MDKRDETKWERRERKYKKRRYGMRVSGRSIKDVLLRVIGKRAKEAEETEAEAEQDRSRKRE